MMEAAELHLAWVWDCDNCGIENFERSFAPSMTQENLEQLSEYVGDSENGDWFAMPDVVVCKHCGMDYRTEFR